MALPSSVIDRENKKFVEDASGDVAVRTKASADAPTIPSGASTEAKQDDTVTELQSLVSFQNKYALKLTESGVYTYVAKAPIGSAEASAVWQAFRIDETSGMKILWADGDSNFNNVATDLTALSYS